MTAFEEIVKYILQSQPKDTTHTPGPWSDVHNFCDPIDGIPQDMGIYEVEQANEEINDLIEDHHIKAQMKAESNRKLIEVAPVMMQMLRDLISHSPVDIESMRHEAKTIIAYVESDLKDNLV